MAGGVAVFDPEPVTKVGAGALVFVALDNYLIGMDKLIYAKSSEPVIVQAVVQAGKLVNVEPKYAKALGEGINDGLMLVGPSRAAMLLREAQASRLAAIGTDRAALETAATASTGVAPTSGGAVPRAHVVGVPESSDAVTLWKAPGKGRTGAAGEVRAGFDPAEYPGDGPYFATDKSIAEGFQQSYGNGLQEINIPRSTFDELVQRGVIRMDGYYEPGRSWHVPADRLAEFNEAVKQGATNQFHP